MWENPADAALRQASVKRGLDLQLKDVSMPMVHVLRGFNVLAAIRIILDHLHKALVKLHLKRVRAEEDHKIKVERQEA